MQGCRWWRAQKLPVLLHALLLRLLLYCHHTAGMAAPSKL
jgi:hypothetical protein